MRTRHLLGGLVVAASLYLLSAVMVLRRTYAAERSNTSGAPCTITYDWPSTLTATCGAQQAFACSGARTKGAIAVGYDAARFVDGFTLNCYVSTTDEVTCEPCCAAGVACNPDSADYHLRVFNP